MNNTQWDSRQCTQNSDTEAGDFLKKVETLGMKRAMTSDSVFLHTVYCMASD
jgi:hypothetical protein